jgi:hypothetical protein
MPTPYADYVADRNPIDLLNSSLEEYRDAATLLSGAAWLTPWAPGKWTLREIMVHVAQWEMILGYRLACAIASPGFVVQLADQDALMARTGGIDGPMAFDAFAAARRMNMALVQALSPDDRATPLQHPEYGPLTAHDVIVQMAGHGMHHLKQIRATLAPRGEDAYSA